VYWLAVIIVLVPMIVLHEFGHFIVAKFFGIRVETFSLGFGKRLWGVRKGDTDYRISLIPLGGYVKMAGENLDEQVTGAPYEFMSKPKWQRLCVAFAGPVMNVLTALAVTAAIAMVHHEVPAYMDKPALIAGVAPGSAAERAGIQAGDVIVKIDGQQNPTFADVFYRVMLNPDLTLPVTIKRGDELRQLDLRPASVSVDDDNVGSAGLEPQYEPNAKLYSTDVRSGYPALEAGLKDGDQMIAVGGSPLEQNDSGRDALVNAIIASGGQPMVITVVRDGQRIDITAVPQMRDGRYRLGFTPAVGEGARKLSLLPALKYSYQQNLRVLWLTKVALTQVATRKRSAGNTFAGPLRILKFSRDAAEQGLLSLLGLMSLLSLNLGIFNLLPIPVLDGGLIFMLLLESLLGLVGLTLTRPVKERMMQVGFVLLMVLVVFVFINDIRKMIPSRGEPQQVEQPARSPGK
jgi:regulator of sigma E protease